MIRRTKYHIEMCVGIAFFTCAFQLAFAAPPAEITIVKGTNDDDDNGPEPGRLRHNG